MQTQHSDEWLPLDKLRVAKFEENLVVVRPVDSDVIVPLFCPFCELPLRTADDALSYRQEHVCYLCDLFWMKPYGTRIRNGTLNPKTDMADKWNDYLLSREKQYKTNVSFV